MTEISADLVKTLREMTSAPMMDCKRALQDSGGDLEAAKQLLRERGMASASKRAGQETTEGIVLARVDDSKGTIVAVGSETEPVSKNEEFQSFAEKVLRAVHAQGVAAVDQLDEERLELIGKLSENIVIVDAVQFEVFDGHVVSGYAHPPANKIGVLVDLEGEGATPELARQIAMHISFAAPEWTTREQVPAEVVDSERQIFLNSDEVQSKPEAAREKIVDGMLGKRFFAATPGGVLADQNFRLGGVSAGGVFVFAADGKKWPCGEDQAEEQNAWHVWDLPDNWMRRAKCIGSREAPQETWHESWFGRTQDSLTRRMASTSHVMSRGYTLDPTSPQSSGR